MAYIRHNVPAVSALYFQRRSALLLTLFFFVLGISAGAFTELFLPDDSKSQVAAYLTQNLFAQEAAQAPQAVFLKSAGNNLGLLLVTFLSGLTAFGVPAAYAAVVYKGAALGFSSALLLEALAARGVLTLLFAVLPPNLLILPALLLSTGAAVNAALNGARRRRTPGRRKSLSVEAGSYLACFFLPFLCILFGSLLEAFICPAFLRLIG